MCFSIVSTASHSDIIDGVQTLFRRISIMVELRESSPLQWVFCGRDYTEIPCSLLYFHTRDTAQTFFIKVGVWGNFKLPVGKKLAVRALSCSFQTKSLGQRRRLEVNVVYYYTSNRRLIIILNGCAGQPAVLVLLKADFAHLPKGIISIAWKY